MDTQYCNSGKNKTRVDTGLTTLLLVDDDRLILSTLGKGLATAGYNVIRAGSAEEALNAASRVDSTISLAIVDIALPRLSGTELGRLLGQRHGIPSLFLSAYSDQNTVEAAIASGGVGYLVKPVDISGLIPAVKAALARSREISCLMRHKDQLEHALTGGREISICMGILMERRGVTAQVAYDILRRQARSKQLKLEEVAKNIVASEELLNKAGNPA